MSDESHVFGTMPYFMRLFASGRVVTPDGVVHARWTTTNCITLCENAAEAQFIPDADITAAPAHAAVTCLGCLGAREDS
jgi:hypothetical protein